LAAGRPPWRGFGRGSHIAALRAVVIPPVPSPSALVAALEGVLDGRESGIVPLPADEREAELLAGALRVGEDVADDVAVVVSTSGTTGTPKGAMLTAAALIASADATNERLGGPGSWLLALPAHHVAGLQVVVRSIISGTIPVTLIPSFAPGELRAAIDEMDSGRRYASLVAVQLDKALADPVDAAALAELDAVLIGGGPMPAGLAERASRAGVSVVRTYGMSETAGGCVYDGVPLEGVAVRIDDGRILLGGATLAKGYRNPVTPDPFAEPGWFRTDDAGAVDDSGALRVLGRIDDAISTGGLTVMPGLVEAALATHPAIADCAVFGVTDPRLGQRVAAAVVLTAGDAPPTPAELREHVSRTLDATAAPREVHVVDELPRRGIGKVDRRELTARFDTGA
jgi:o-succinylbenzoate---CoA ligase